MNPPDYVDSLIERYPGAHARSDLHALNHELRAKTVRAIDYLLLEASRIEKEHGFGDQTPGEDIALMHSELSEALEEIRAGHALSKLYYREDLKPEGVPAELADCLIRIAGMARRHNIDLAEAVVRKMLFNETRPFKHGGKTL